MKGERNDIVLEVDGIYYELSFMYFENLKQYCDTGIYIYMKNVFPVDDISINNIVKNLKINVEEKTYIYLTKVELYVLENEPSESGNWWYYDVDGTTILKKII